MKCESISLHLIDEFISFKERVFKKSKFREIRYVIRFVLFQECWFFYVQVKLQFYVPCTVHCAIIM